MSAVRRVPSMSQRQVEADEPVNAVEQGSVESTVVAEASQMLSRRFGGEPELSDIESLSGSGNAVVVLSLIHI